MSESKKVLIIENHPLFREGLKTILQGSTEYIAAGEAGNAVDGMRAAKSIKPHVILMDLSLPDKSGIQLSREVRHELPETYILVVSMHSKIDYILEAFQAGVSGYVVKDSASTKLLEALKVICKGDYYLDSALSNAVVENLMSLPAGTNASQEQNAYNTLTRREQEILRLLVKGMTNKEIAEKLFISPKTVENHRGNIMNKLDLHSSVELVRYAARLGLVDTVLWK